MEALQQCFRQLLEELARHEPDEGLVFGMRRRRFVVSALIQAYNQLSTWTSRKAFFLALTEDLDSPGKKAKEFVTSTQNYLSLERLQRALLTTHELFLRETGSLPGGVEWTIEARGHLLYLLSSSKRGHGSEYQADVSDFLHSDANVCWKLQEDALKNPGSFGQFSKYSNLTTIRNPPHIRQGNAYLSKEEFSSLQRLDKSVKFLFATQIAVSMKQIGFWKNLVERRNTVPCTNTLMRFIWSKEAVHPIRNSSDLQQRLGLVDSRRRCYGLFHPTMPDVPLVFVEVLVSPRLCSSVDEILPVTGSGNTQASDDSRGESTAVFYSITNPHRGLQGLQLASLLLYLVMDRINQEEAITSFATLSPIPSFAKWLRTRIGNEGMKSLISVSERERLMRILNVQNEANLGGAVLGELTQGHWRSDSHKTKTLKPLLERWAARYILFERKQSSRGSRIRDPVGNFHGQNGATLERIRVDAFLTPTGLKQSFGVMVNYRYRLDSVGEAARAYKRQSVVVSAEVAWNFGPSIDLPETSASSRLLRGLPAQRHNTDVGGLYLYAQTFQQGQLVFDSSKSSHITTRFPAIYFVAYGQVDVSIYYENGMSPRLTEMGPGDAFADITKLYQFLKETAGDKIHDEDFRRFPEFFTASRIVASTASTTHIFVLPLDSSLVYKALESIPDSINVIQQNALKELAQTRNKLVPIDDKEAKL